MARRGERSWRFARGLGRSAAVASAIVLVAPGLLLPPAARADDADRADAAYKEAVERAERDAAAKLDKALRSFDKALEEALKAATRAGDLREADRIEAARGAVAARLAELAGGEPDPDAVRRGAIAASPPRRRARRASGSWTRRATPRPRSPSA